MKVHLYNLIHILTPKQISMGDIVEIYQGIVPSCAYTPKSVNYIERKLANGLSDSRILFATCHHCTFFAMILHRICF